MRQFKPSFQLFLVTDAFVAGTLVAKLAGAGWGVAASVGQITFAAVLVAVLLLSPSR